MTKKQKAVIYIKAIGFSLSAILAGCLFVFSLIGIKVTIDRAAAADEADKPCVCCYCAQLGGEK